MIEVVMTGAQGIHDMLGHFIEPEMTKRAQRATKAGAMVLAAPLRAAVTPLSKRMGRSVWIHVAKREKPAYVVGHHKRVAFFWHMVIGGTRDHGPRSAPLLYFYGKDGQSHRPARVRGVPAHPIIEAVAQAYGQQAYEAVAADLMKEN